MPVKVGEMDHQSSHTLSVEARFSALAVASPLFGLRLNGLLSWTSRITRGRKGQSLEMYMQWSGASLMVLTSFVHQTGAPSIPLQMGAQHFHASFQDEAVLFRPV